jgi:hypothetical protein
VEESASESPHHSASEVVASQIAEEDVHMAQIMKESEPMLLTNIMIFHPFKWICFIYVLLIIFGSITAGLGYMMPNLEGTRSRDFKIWDDPYQVDADELTLIQEWLDQTRGEPVVALQTEYANTVFVLYEHTGNHEFGLLDVGAIKKMKELEDEI